MLKRCDWVDLKNTDYIEYHDREWGVPVHSDKKLFEMLILEGAQAGLSWTTILKKRKNYRRAFNNFDFNKIAKYNQRDLARLLHDEGIVRNQQKIRATVDNARAFIKIRTEVGTFNQYLWSFVNGQTICNNFRSIKEIPAQTKISEKISKDLKDRGMRFVGPTIIYAFLQAVGVVNDHQKNCFRYKEIKNLLK